MKFVVKCKLQKILIQKHWTVKHGEKRTFNVREERVKSALVAGALNLECQVIFKIPTEAFTEKVIRRNEAKLVKEPFSLQVPNRAFSYTTS